MAFWDQITNLFNRAEDSGPAAPTIHEMIERTDAEQADYDRWARTGGPQRLLDWLNEQYAIKLGKGRPDSSIDFLDTPSSKGFVIHFHQTNYTPAEVTHFFDYLKERVLALNYRTQISDRRIFPRNHWIETQERHYLKPRLERGNFTDVDQRFGNIMIENELRDDKAWNLRLRATTYQDAMYREAASFRALMVAIG